MQKIASIVIDRKVTQRARYWWYILVGAAIMILEAVLLAFRVKSYARRERVEDALHDVSGQLINAQEEERRRIARELHDDINQQLALLAVELQSLENVAPQLSQLQMKERLRRVWKNANAVSEDLQRIAHRLHPPKLELLGLEGAIRGLCTELKQAGVEVDVHIHTLPALVSKEVSLALFRVAQEALHNAKKHSKARHTRLELLADAYDVVLRVSDDGVGFDVCALNDKRLGIPSMQERMRLIEGELEIDSRPGAGTQIEARVPLRAGSMQGRIAS
jgi:signal transduction histidine kinase